jgi:hypothetical protein
MLALLLAGLAPSSADAQCGDLTVDCDESSSAYHEFGPPFGEEGYEGTNPHPCLACVGTGGPTDPEDCHPACEITFAGNLELQSAFRDLLRAATSGDAYAVLAAARLVPDRVHLNQSRRSLQVLGCGDRIVANVPMHELFDVATIAIALAQAQPLADGNRLVSSLTPATVRSP